MYAQIILTALLVANINAVYRISPMLHASNNRQAIATETTRVSNKKLDMGTFQKVGNREESTESIFPKELYLLGRDEGGIDVKRNPQSMFSTTCSFFKAKLCFGGDRKVSKS